jgi:serine/threonine protein kinase
VLFWLLTGRDPFQHRLGLFPLLYAHVHEPPSPPSAVARQPISTALDRLVLRALAKRPEDRFCNAEAMMVALDALSPSSTPQRWPQTERIETRAFRPLLENEDQDADEGTKRPTMPLPAQESPIPLDVPALVAAPRLIAAPNFVRREPQRVIAMALLTVALVALAVLLYTYLQGGP